MCKQTFKTIYSIRLSIGSLSFLQNLHVVKTSREPVEGCRTKGLKGSGQELFRQSKSHSHEDCHLSFGNPATRAYDRLIRGFAFPSSNGMPFRERTFGISTIQNVRHLCPRIYRKIMGKLYDLESDIMWKNQR